MAYSNFVREVAIRSTKRRVTGSTQINSAADIARLCRDLEAETQEHFVVLCLDTQYAVTSRQTVSIGTVSETMVHPREVFRAAIMQGAYAIALVHNHPSGSTAPSEPDLGVTQRMCEAGELLGIEVYDHVIVGAGEYFSFKEESKRRSEAKYPPPPKVFEELIVQLLGGCR
jgi:DNA repair protein RadC